MRWIATDGKKDGPGNVMTSDQVYYYITGLKLLNNSLPALKRVHIIR
jgi:hypothetical protein